LIAYTQQLNLPFAHDEHSLRDRLRQLTDVSLELVITDNATSMLSIRKKAEGMEVRLHRMFLHAGPDICLEVAQLIKKGRSNRLLIRSFINQNAYLLRQRLRMTTPAFFAGQHFCLKTIYESLNSEYFGGMVSASITWGRNSSRNRVKLRTLGSYNVETNTIRINPLFDKKTVSVYFLEFIVYHEMLHAFLGIKNRNGRRSIHSKEFRIEEKKFRHYEKAIEWERKRFGIRHH
jgi:hypothetical protein